MSILNDQQIDLIARKVLESMGNKTDPKTEVMSKYSNGIFNTIDDAVRAATVAQKQLVELPLEKRKEMISSIRKVMTEYAVELAREAWEETELGRFKDKIEKNNLVINKTPGVEDIEPTAWSGDRGLTVMERAPFGVIGALTPCTNPTSTIICNTIGMVAAGNSVVFNVHPTAKRISVKTVSLINDAIIAVGGPRNVIVTIAEPSIPSAQQLMSHPGIRILVITGGGGVVKAAMNSGKRAICAGPGNPPVIVDETADIFNAAKNIYMGASLDNGIICVDEKECFVVESVADQLIRALKKEGAYHVSQAQLKQLERVIFKEMAPPRGHAVMNKDLIGKNASVILAKIGKTVPDSCRLIIVETDFDHPLVWTEQMMPVMPIVRVKDADQAIDYAKQAEQGNGHSAIMHSTNLDNLSRMAREINTSIFVKNGMGASGLGFGGEGFTSFTIASPTGEGLTSPRSFSRERRCILVDHFRII